jgi:hypothetical protein
MSRDRKWLVQTGGKSWRVTARTAKAAVRKAFKQRAPKSVGIFVSMRDLGKSEEEGTSYCLGHIALQWAGYETEVPTCEEYMAAAK